MMDDFLNLLNAYGPAVYTLLFAYCAFKSGALPLFAGYAAQAGALDVVIVAAATFAGGYLGDEARFALARRYGEHLTRGRPRLHRLAENGKLLLDRYGAAYIFLYRYPKGMRTIGAFPVGYTEMPWRKFSALNAASALVWCIALVGTGYLFGELVKQAVENGWGAVSVILLIAFLGMSYLAWIRVSRLAAVEKA